MSKEASTASGNINWKWKVWQFAVVPPNELIGKTMGSNKKKRGKGVYPGEFPLEFYNTLAKIFVDKDDIVLYIWANVLKVRLIIFIADIV